MATYKVIMLTDASLTNEKVNMEGAQNVLARLKKVDADVTYVTDMAGWDRPKFVEYAPKIEKDGPEGFWVNKDLLKEIEDADVLIANFSPVGSKIIKAGKKLKMIGITRSGAENVNIEYAKKHGVRVAVSPGRLADPVSDYTIGLILAETRNIARSAVIEHNGAWITSLPQDSYVRNLKGQTVGIVGLGIIGQRVIEKLTPFNCNFIAYDPFTPAEIFEYLNTKSVSLEELFSTADIVSIHARMMESTRGLVSRELINMMKPHAYFINTARAGLVDMDALTEALLEHRIGGAGLDVLVDEPVNPDNPILKCDNVTLTPHRAGGISNLAEVSLDIIIDDVIRCLKGEELLHPKA